MAMTQSGDLPYTPDMNSPLAFFMMFFRNNQELNLYRYVALVSVIIMFQFVITGVVAPGRVRGKVFTKEFMEENFTT